MRTTPKLPAKLCAFALVAISACLVATDANAGREVKNNTRTSVNKNTNKNVNVNSNKNVNVNTNRHVDVDVDVDRHHHPIGTAVAVGATIAVTSAIVGSMVYALPPACVPVQIGAMLYQQCGGAYYQPQYVGTSVQYIVVAPPR